MTVEPDTTSVSITASALTPVSGRGDIKYTASVLLDIGGVVIELDGWTPRQDKTGKMRAFRHDMACDSGAYAVRWVVPASCASLTRIPRRWGDWTILPSSQWSA